MFCLECRIEQSVLRIAQEGTRRFLRWAQIQWGIKRAQSCVLRRRFIDLSDYESEGPELDSQGARK